MTEKQGGQRSLEASWQAASLAIRHLLIPQENQKGNFMKTLFDILATFKPERKNHLAKLGYCLSHRRPIFHTFYYFLSSCNLKGTEISSRGVTNIVTCYLIRMIIFHLSQSCLNRFFHPSKMILQDLQLQRQVADGRWTGG